MHINLLLVQILQITFTPYAEVLKRQRNRISGRTIDELERNKENLLIYNFENIADDFGAKGRRLISDVLTEKPEFEKHNFISGYCPS